MHVTPGRSSPHQSHAVSAAEMRARQRYPPSLKPVKSATSHLEDLTDQSVAEHVGPQVPLQLRGSHASSVEAVSQVSAYFCLEDKKGGPG